MRTEIKRFGGTSKVSGRQANSSSSVVFLIFALISKFSLVINGIRWYHFAKPYPFQVRLRRSAGTGVCFTYMS